VRILGYFSKLKGARERTNLGNTGVEECVWIRLSQHVDRWGDVLFCLSNDAVSTQVIRIASVVPLAVSGE
jgi:hypothetical protein